MPCNMHENGHLATLSVIKQTHVIFFQLSEMLPIRISYWKWVVAVSWLSSFVYSFRGKPFSLCGILSFFLSNYFLLQEAVAASSVSPSLFCFHSCVLLRNMITCGPFAQLTSWTYFLVCCSVIIAWPLLLRGWINPSAAVVLLGLHFHPN